MDRLRLIQLGAAVADADGTVRGAWSFNLAHLGISKTGGGWWGVGVWVEVLVGKITQTSDACPGLRKPFVRSKDLDCMKKISPSAFCLFQSISLGLDCGQLFLAVSKGLSLVTAVVTGMPRLATQKGSLLDDSKVPKPAAKV